MVRHFHGLGWTVDGLDDTMRTDFFGPPGTRAGIKGSCFKT